ncbi:MAG: putative DNA binding domain-containing protein [Candidatus Hydrogenedentes bacterium]|nr:putative DNA binding domain-containing protein [Candidatus Hydrogenedentota bacterium]
MDDIIQRALSVDRESAEVDFKQAFDVNSTGSWCEIVKDIVAMANSGGGVVILGLCDDGSPSPQDCSQALKIDPAVVADKVRKYTGPHQLDLKLTVVRKQESEVVAIAIGGVRHPLVFQNVGTYEVESGRQKTAFSVGQIYFRHGAKSEPGTTDDIRACIDREVSCLREEWLGNIRKVVEAPLGSLVTVATTSQSSDSIQPSIPTRLVHAEGAMPVAWRSPDETHPHRQKEVVSVINQRLGGTHRITSYDVQCARKEFKADTDPNLVYKSKFGMVQYSDAFVSAVVDEFRNDPGFFANLRIKHSRRRTRAAI